MKTIADIKINNYVRDGIQHTYKSLHYDDNELIDAPMWYHKRGLSQTASGYGKKLNTGKKIMFNGRLYRVYCSIFSNIGTCYIISKGERIILTSY
jgi:hypothetical protein